MSTTTTLPWFANELASLDPSSFVGCIEQTSGSGTRFDPAYCRCAIFMAPGYYATSPKWLSVSDFWFEFRLSCGSTGLNACQTLSFFSAGIEVLRMTATTNGSSSGSIDWKIFTLQSSVLTQVGTAFTIPAPVTPYQFAIRVKGGGAGLVEFYSSGTFIAAISATGLNHSFAGVDQVQPMSVGVPFNGSDTWWTEMIADSVAHIEGRVKTFPIDTLSSVNNQWTGGVANVDKIISDDSSFVSTQIGRAHV